MSLELEITSYHRLSPTVEAKIQLSRTALKIGRAADSDWRLPDPERVVSSRHAQISYRHGHYWLKDTSTNGVFCNGSPQAVGRNNEVKLSAGDCLRLGDYEISVRAVASTNTALSADTTMQHKPHDSADSHIAEASRAQMNTGSVAAPSHSSLSSLASALSEHNLIDSHVQVPEAIPTSWGWDDGATPVSSRLAGTDQVEGNGGDASEDERLRALLEGMGISALFQNAEPTPAFMRDLGSLIQAILENLLDLLHARAAQKQKLRVQQTTFQRSENNPLKFSANAQDIVEALLLKRHPSFLAADDAVDEAFADILSHERAVLRGVESVIHALLAPGSIEEEKIGRWPLVGRAKMLALLASDREALLNEYGDIDRMLRSQVFVEAYEQAVRTRL